MAAINVLGVFAHVDTTLDAIRKLREKGFSTDRLTPVTVEEIEEEREGPASAGEALRSSEPDRPATGFSDHRPSPSGGS